MINKLAVCKDKLGSDVVIKSTTTLSHTPVLPFFLKNFSQLIERGFSHSVMPQLNNSRAVYAEIDGKIVGHIVYSIQDDPTKTAWVMLSAVDEDFRQRGIYKLMNEYFENLVKMQGSKKVASYVHVDNKAMIASCESAGRRPYYYRMEKNLG